MKLQPKQYGTDSIDLGDGTRIDAHFANNAGRGGNNVTLSRVSSDVERPAYTRGYESVIAQTTTSGWNGNYRLSSRVRHDLGIE